MRGEYVETKFMNSTNSGSPPLAWGILFGAESVDSFVRITPTCVGNTQRQPPPGFQFRDHPHLRGEYPVSGSQSGERLGSPPLAWGIRHQSNPPKVKEGITPTCVGNTQHTPQQLYQSQDHPHLRGEYASPSKNLAPEKGSPPLAWGIRLSITRRPATYRITPTCVGNTLGQGWRRQDYKDHPHLRGEYPAKSVRC